MSLDRFKLKLSVAVLMPIICWRNHQLHPVLSSLRTEFHPTYQAFSAGLDRVALIGVHTEENRRETRIAIQEANPFHIHIYQCDCIFSSMYEVELERRPTRRRNWVT